MIEKEPKPTNEPSDAKRVASGEFKFDQEINAAIITKLLPEFLTPGIVGLDIPKMSLFDLKDYQQRELDKKEQQENATEEIQPENLARPLSTEEESFFQSFRYLDTSMYGINLPAVDPAEVVTTKETVEWVPPLTGESTGIRLKEGVAALAAEISLLYYDLTGEELEIQAGFRSEDGSTAMLIGFLSMMSFEEALQRAAKPGESSHAVNAIDWRTMQTGEIPTELDEMTEYYRRVENSRMNAFFTVLEQAGVLTRPYTDGNAFGVTYEPWHTELNMDNPVDLSEINRELFRF